MIAKFRRIIFVVFGLLFWLPVRVCCWFVSVIADALDSRVTELNRQQLGLREEIDVHREAIGQLIAEQDEQQRQINRYIVSVKESQGMSKELAIEILKSLLVQPD